MFEDGITYQNHVWGFRLPTPNGPKRFRLRSGVTALVGLNGSGKTMALAGIEEALAGEQGKDARLASLSNTTRNPKSPSNPIFRFEGVEAIEPSAAPYVDSDYPLAYWAASDPRVPFLASLVSGRTGDSLVDIIAAAMADQIHELSHPKPYPRLVKGFCHRQFGQKITTPSSAQGLHDESNRQGQGQEFPYLLFPGEFLVHAESSTHGLQCSCL